MLPSLSSPLGGTRQTPIIILPGGSGMHGVQRSSPDISAMLSFLVDELEAGRQYRSLNCYRSALSSNLLSIEGLPVGQHHLSSDT